MIHVAALLLALALQQSDTTPVTPAAPQSVPDSIAIVRIDAASPIPAEPSDTVRRRPKAIEYSDAYNTRLTIHRYGSYVEFPLFAAEWALGQQLINGTSSSWVRPTHTGVALGLGALFTVNTVTGLWNLYDSRQDPAGRTRRVLHTVLMLAADGGFAAAGAMGSNAHSTSSDQAHKNVALGSMAVAGVGTLMMWLWKD